MLLAVVLLATQLPSSTVHADSAQDPTAFMVGFEPLPRDLHSGDQWEGGVVDEVNRALQHARILTDQPERFQDEASSRADVRYVEEDHVEDWLVLQPDDPKWDDQYGLERIQAPGAWDTTLGSPEITVCVVDTGVRYTHQDLAGTRWLGGYDFVNEDSDAWDDHGHGTFTTAIAVATTADGAGMAGTAQAGFLHAKVLSSSGSGSHSDVAKGIQWCADRGADVINLSLGGSGSQTLHDALFYAKDAGALTIAAAGNLGPCSDCVSYPAAYGQAVAVPCTDQDNAQCSFSSQGPETEIAAPGKDILSASYQGDSRYAMGSGTSASAPFVSGVAALVWSKNPDLNRNEVRQILRDTAKDLGPTGRDDRFGYGLVDASAALDATPYVEAPGPLEDALNETFDGTLDPSWSFTGLWHVDDACATAPSLPNYLGYHRTDACTYNQGLDRTQGTATVTVDLTEAHWAQLDLDHRWETESTDAAVEEMKVEVKPADESTWTTVQRWDSRDANQLAWTEITQSLSFYSGTTLEIRFVFDTVDGLANDHPGWFIDDVRVQQVTNLAPSAYAGPNQTLADADDDGVEPVTLDATSSRDPDGTITSHTWSLGDQTLATTALAEVDLPVGSHLVNLTVEDDEGATAMDQITVTIDPNQAPTADAGPDQLIGDDDGDGEETVDLTGAGSMDPDGTITGYTWSQDGVQIATGQEAQVTLPQGRHTLTLEVTDDGGATASDQVVVEIVDNLPPIADAGPDTTLGDADGDGSEPVTLDATSSSDPDGTITGYHWSEEGTDLGTGAQLETVLTTGQHAVTVTVTDNGGATSTDTVNITVEANQPPVADAGPDLTRSDSDDDGTEVVTLDGSGSWDPEDTGLNHTWRENGTLLGHGAILDVELPIGDHTIELEVTDLAGATDTDSAVITVVENLPPTALAEPSFQEAQDSDGDGTETLSFDGSGSSDEDGQVVDWTWTLDGQVLSHDATPTLTLPTGSHQVTLRVTDDAGAEATDTVDAIVHPNQPPVADAGPDLTVSDDDGSGEEPIQADGGGSYDPDGWIERYSWTTQGGSLGTGSQLETSLPVGQHTLTLEVTDSGGAVDTDDLVVEVLANQAPTGRFTADCTQLSCTFSASTSSDPDGQLVDHRWDLGDGSLRQGEVIDHDYRMPGTYTVTLVVEDNGGKTHTLEAPVDVESPVVFHDDLEAGLEGWTINDPSGPAAWQLRSDRSASGQSSLGIRDYGPIEQDILVSPEIDLTGASTATLELNSWIQGERSCLVGCTVDDFGRIEVTADGGQTWRTLLDQHWLGQGPSYNPTWTSLRFSLAPEAGHEVQLRFSFFSDQANHNDGWFIDDIQVGTTPLPVETDLPFMHDPVGDAESASTLDDPRLDLLGVEVRNEASGELTFVLTVEDLSSPSPSPSREAALSGSWGVAWTGPLGTDMVRFIGSAAGTSCDWGTYDGAAFTRMGRAFCSVSTGTPGSIRLLFPSGAMDQRGYTGTEVLQDVRALTHAHHGVPPLSPELAPGALHLHDATYPALHPLG